MPTPHRTAEALPRRPAILLAAALFACSMTPARAAVPDLPPAERQVLIDLYRSTQGPNWSEHDGWDDPDGDDNPVCMWHA